MGKICVRVSRPSWGKRSGNGRRRDQTTATRKTLRRISAFEGAIFVLRPSSAPEMSFLANPIGETPCLHTLSVTDRENRFLHTLSVTEGENSTVPRHHVPEKKIVYFSNYGRGKTIFPQGTRECMQGKHMPSMKTLKKHPWKSYESSEEFFGTSWCFTTIIIAN